MWYEWIETLYGELRGYGRRAIRQAVRRNQLRAPNELAAEAQRLFEKRVREAIELFPLYAKKLRHSLGRLPPPDKPMRPESLPIWTRADQRALFDVTPLPPLPDAFVHRTGGSTGVPLRYWVTRESWEWRTAVSDRGYTWVGAGKGTRSVYVWGTPVYPPTFFPALKARIAATLQRRYYFDSFRFGDEEKRQCCAVINRIRPCALVGYAGNLVELARFVRANPGLLRWRAPTLVTAAEGVTEVQRRLLVETLADDVFVSYGSREFMLMGMECRAHRGLHLSADNLYVEVVDEDGQQLPAGEVGRIVVTDLRNAATPFIRYEIGDLGRMASRDEPCPCGLPFPRLLSVEGRSQEFILLPNGDRLTALFIPHLMKEFPWVEGYQIAQLSPSEIEIRLIANCDLTPELTAPIWSALQPRVGKMRIRFRRVESLTRNISGKVPIVVAPEQESKGNGN
ncbi:MAG: phenylacetate--CoA ligase family protein [Kiritimatiellia bacterium]